MKNIFVCFFLLFPLFIFSDNQYPDYLSETEKKWLSEHPVIRIAPDPEFFPVEFFDENADYKGISADFTELISEKLNHAFQIVRFSSWNEVIEKIKNKEADVLSSVIQTEERKEFLLFSEPYLVIPSVVLVRSNTKLPEDLKEISNFKVSIVQGYGYVDIIKKKYPNFILHYNANLKNALRQVSFGETDAFIGDLATASYYIETEKIVNLKIGKEIEPHNISGYGVRKDWFILVSILNKTIQAIPESEKKAVMQKWLSLKHGESIPKQVLKVFIIVFLAILALLILFLIWNRSLKKLVALRTKELDRELEEKKKTEKELIQAKETAEKASRTKNEFLANMSHELRTPMNGIVGGLSILGLTYLDKEQKEYIDIIKISSDHLLEVINDILDISKIEAGKEGLKEKEFNLISLIEDTASQYKLIAENKNLRFSYSFTSSINPYFFGDSLKITQILNNFLSNAVKFTPKGGDIDFFVKILHEFSDYTVFEFEVSDTGIGIPEDKQDYIFESFSQIDSSASKHYPGTGLGLSIAKKLTDMMGGVISVKSNLGKGSVFKAEIKLKKLK